VEVDRLIDHGDDGTGAERDRRVRQDLALRLGQRRQQGQHAPPVWAVERRRRRAARLARLLERAQGVQLVLDGEPVADQPAHAAAHRPPALDRQRLARHQGQRHAG
jgi:hypothetical protein